MIGMFIDATVAICFGAFVICNKYLRLGVTRMICICVGVALTAVTFFINQLTGGETSACIFCPCAVIVYIVMTMPKPEDDDEEDEDNEDADNAEPEDSEESNADSPMSENDRTEVKRRLRLLQTSDDSDDVPNEDGLTYTEVRNKLLGNSSSNETPSEYISKVTTESKRDFIEACELCGFVTEGKTVEQLVKEVYPCVSDVQIRNLPPNLRNDETLVAMNALKARVNKRR